MFVVKRSGKKEDVKFDKITARIRKMVYGLDPDHVEPIEVAKKVIEGVYDGVPTTELDNLAAETAASMTTRHPDYATLAAPYRRVQPAQKRRRNRFPKTVDKLRKYEDPITNEAAPLDWWIQL